MITPLPHKPHSDVDAAEDNAEARMRQALGKLGTAKPGKPEPLRRKSYQAKPGTGRHRFKQDGEVPVVRLTLSQGDRSGERQPPAPVASVGALQGRAGEGRDHGSSESVRQVVCTLCSCYPRAVLDYPPFWFKSASYRARAVRDPRGVLAEWGTVLAPGTEVRVVDSTADYRWMVLPIRPDGTEDWLEDRLAALVSEGDMIGVSVPSPMPPEPGPNHVGDVRPAGT